MVDAKALKVTAPSGKKFRHRGTQGASGGYITSSIIGTYVEIEATADDLVIHKIGGSWDYDGVGTFSGGIGSMLRPQVFSSLEWSDDYLMEKAA